MNKLLAFLVFLALPFLALCQKNSSAKPNIIVIMTDDLGYADVGFNGCKDISTPNIDRIADSGMVFTNGYTSYPVCGPSRAGLITGRYQQRFGFERNPQYRTDDINMGLPQEEMTLAESLEKVGYNSGIVGKWHLGAHKENHPLNRGFDYFFGHLGGGHNYFPELLTIKDSYSATDEPSSYKTWIMENHQPVKTTEYLTDEFSNAAVRFIQKNHESPFFLYLAYNAPHGPLQATQKYLDRFPEIEDKKRKTYAAMVSAVDDGVGKVLDELKSLGIEENTLIFFLSDNGGPEDKNGSNNGPLREGKSSIYEGGNRVPFAFQWKGHVNPGIYNNPVSSLDIFATISALSGSPTHKDRPLDGVNLMPYLSGKTKKRPHEMLYVRKFDEDLYSVRYRDFKLVTKKDNTVKELYNIAEDIGEESNIADQHPKVVKKLEALRSEWDDLLIEPVFLGLIHTNAWKNKKNKN